MIETETPPVGAEPIKECSNGRCLRRKACLHRPCRAADDAFFKEAKRSQAASRRREAMYREAFS